MKSERQSFSLDDHFSTDVLHSVNGSQSRSTSLISRKQQQDQLVSPARPMLKAAVILFACGSLLITSSCAMIDDAGKSNETVNHTISDSSKETASGQDQNTTETDASIPTVRETSAEVAVDEQVLVDQNDLVITLKKLIPDALMGPALQIQIENNSDQSVTIQARNLSVNNIMLASIFASEVAAGKKANENIILMESDLERAGVDVIKEIEFYFDVSDSETYKTIFESEILTITTSGSESYEQTYDDSGILVVDQGDVRLVVKKKIDENSLLGSAVLIYLENNSEQDILVQACDTSVNGLMINAIFSCQISAGKRAFDTLTFLDSDLEENDISEIEQIELYFTVTNNRTFDRIFESDVVKVSFSEE